ncbi:MAG TPA: glycosyltransferase [Solirubrobacterales bacterium]|nr:glycosyltransferase [Solirubrobacterales bacterium]
MTTLLVASTGGHLKQLSQLYSRLEGVEGPFRWATFDTPQSRSLLAGEEVDFVPFVGGRDPLNVGRNFAHARRILRQHEVGTLVSTGSAVALPFFLIGRARRLRCHYIESAARSEGPSLTGKLISRVPGVHLYCQYPSWAGGGWRFRGSVFDAFEPGERGAGEGAAVGEAPRKVVVTLGSYRGYGFPLLVERLLELLPAEAEVLWQTGDTDVSRFGIEGREAIPERELTAAMAAADVVVAHAGVGAALAAFEVGKCPLLVPRRLSREEHVDDHQIQIAGELSRRGIAVAAEAPELSAEHLAAAAAKAVVRRPDPPPIATG